MRLIPIAICGLVVLSGCIGDQRNVQDARYPVLPSPASIAEALPGDVSAVTSNNAVQSAQTGALNIEVAKIAEKLDATLARFELQARDISAVKAEAGRDISAVKMNIGQDLSAFKAQMDARFDVVTQATATATASAVATLSGRIDKIETNLTATATGLDLSRKDLTTLAESVRNNQKAGRDATTTINSGVAEMERALESTNAMIIRVVAGAFGLVSVLGGLLVAFLHYRNGARSNSRHQATAVQIATLTAAVAQIIKRTPIPEVPNAPQP
jgi:hypothetical protein